METPQHPAAPQHPEGHLPPPTPPVPGPDPGKPAESTVPRGRRLRLVLTVVGGVLALFCLGGVAVAFVLYDDATKIDRGSPDAVVDNFLRAYLVNRSDSEAALFSCKTAANLDAIAALRDEMIARENEFDVKVGVTWSSLTVSQIDARHSSVDAGLVIAGSADGQTRSRRTEQWSFDVADDGGWRVCGATKVV